MAKATAKSSGAAAPLDLATPRRNTLKQWLDWQRTLHPSSIDLGLERVAAVLRTLGLESPPYPVITVAGTNGKGSTVAFLQAILRAGGYRVGSYTSPHLLRYNERVQIDAQPVSDRALCRSFARIDAARGDHSLSFFEFGTLAALDLFSRAELDVGVLEVGLGGRLDAVNALDADAAAVTSVALDHTDWLGADRDSIGFEKAGVFRAGRPAVCADPDPPPRLLRHAAAIGARLLRAGVDYRYDDAAGDGSRWRWRGRFDGRWFELSDLPAPALAGVHQRSNAAAALTLLYSLRERLPLPPRAFRDGLERAVHPARFQRLAGPSHSAAQWVLDIAHNPQGAAALARCLRDDPVSGRNVAVIGMLRDKDVAGVARALQRQVSRWYTITLAGERGMTATQLARRLQQAGIAGDTISAHSGTGAALLQAADDTGADDRVVVCGSLYAVAKAIRTQLFRR